MVFNYVTIFSLALFVKFTFYQKRKSAFPYIVVSFTVLIITETILKLIFQFQPGFSYPSNPEVIPFFFIYILVSASQKLIVMIWYSISIFKSYNNFRKLKIGYWLKVRYLMLGISTIIFSIDTSLSVLLLIDDFNIILFLVYASIFNVLLFSLVNFIAWVIPFKTLTLYLKGEPRESLENLSEAEILARLKSELSEDSISGNH